MNTEAKSMFPAVGGNRPQPAARDPKMWVDEFESKKAVQQNKTPKS